MAKYTTHLLFITLLLCYTLADAIRRYPTFSDAETQLKGADAEHGEVVDIESCDGVAAEEECLMRRTLAAHLDYIYTQKHKP